MTSIAALYVSPLSRSQRTPWVVSLSMGRYGPVHVHVVHGANNCCHLCVLVYVYEIDYFVWLISGTSNWNLLGFPFSKVSCL